MRTQEMMIRYDDKNADHGFANSHFVWLGIMIRKTILMAAMATAGLLAGTAGFAAEDLEKHFVNPPDETKPWCYWYWLNSDITREGITKDLEAMSKVGIAQAMIGNINQGIVTKTPVKMFTPEWMSLTRHALAEAGRLGIRLYMFNAPGWSQSGGPWIKPEQSMRRVVWNEIAAKGGPFSAKVRNAPQDIAVLAVPTLALPVVSLVPEGAPGSRPGNLLRFERNEPWTVRGLTLLPKTPGYTLDGKLYSLDNSGKRAFIADIKANPANPMTDFMPTGALTFSLPETTAKAFELETTVIKGIAEVRLSSASLVASAVEKQMGRMHPTPSPTWRSYIFPDTLEPSDASALVRRDAVINLTGKLDATGQLTCELPPGDWTVIYFGMVTTGKYNQPAPPEGTGLECDKMSKEHIRYHFHSMFDSLLAQMTPEERKAFAGVTIDSYEVGAQNWTDGFDKIFSERNGYGPILMLPALTGRVIESAKASDRFLWDLRRTVADLIAENYIGGLRAVAAENGFRTWCENYGHWGFPGEFLLYGGKADQISGEFWSRGLDLGTIECRAASSAAHIYGKNEVFAEAFTSVLYLYEHPYSIKPRGEELFCAGVNHFVLHVVAHQPRDGVPGLNPGFGNAFHRNTPWFLHSRNWVRYLQRCHFMLAQGEPVADVAVYIGDFAPQMTGPANPVPSGYDYDYINSDALLRTIRVENGCFVVPDEKNPKRIAARYKAVALPQEPAARQMRPHVSARIEALKKQGGLFLEGVPVPPQVMQGLKLAPLVSRTSRPIRWKVRQLDDGMLFFLCNFKQAGPFEATLRVNGMVPELFNPVTGETRRLARFWNDGDGTRVAINVRDPSDSFFLVFREKCRGQASVVSALRDGKPASSADLELSFDARGDLIGEATQPGTYKLTMSDGTQRQATIAAPCEPLVIKDGWVVVAGEDAANTITQELQFNCPDLLSKAEVVMLDLGPVNVMATATLNGKAFETLWMPPFELDVTKALMPGLNRLRLKVVSTSPTKPSFGPEIRFKPVLRARFPRTPVNSEIQGKRHDQGIPEE